MGLLLFFTFDAMPVTTRSRCSHVRRSLRIMVESEQSMSALFGNSWLQVVDQHD